MTDTGIGNEGVKTISETLKGNTSLTKVCLKSKKRKNCIRKGKKRKRTQFMAENDIGVEGAKALSEMLAVNTTLKHLSLWSEE